MAFGRRDDKADEPAIQSVAGPSAPSAGEGGSILGANVHIEGNLIGGGEVRLEGNFKGKIVHEGRLIIAETAVVKASVHARDLVVFGRVEGDVDTSGLLELKPTARLVGTIKAPRLVISAGASVAADCDVAADDRSWVDVGAGEPEEDGAPAARI